MARERPVDPPPQDPSTETADPMRTSAMLPDRIGRYHIKRVIASGGMGTVYEATQDNPRRVVAVKVMKQGIASKSALRRFEYEGQILGRLRHPGIAQIYEAGTHVIEPRASARADLQANDSSGDISSYAVPYFAMEYIPNAKPITKYADEKKLGTRQRMELFAKVCDAVHHGHQKGIIHRDLKPSNILVTSDPSAPPLAKGGLGGVGQVKIIDFGVARSTDSDLAVTTLQTDVGQLVGTLQYMSPEQCEGDPHDIDTRSDVYALGVVFYEMLCGKPPYDVTRIPMHQATRAIREQHPTKLSTLDRTLRGDVETIALKALEKERSRRYQSAADFARDIQRYLNNDPISARPPSAIYQFRKFAERNRALVTGVAGTMLALAAGLVASTLLYLRSEQARDEANAVVHFLGGMFADVDPRGGDKDITVREVLDQASMTIGERFKDKPLVEAYLRHTMANSYQGLGLWDEAEKHAVAAATLRRRVLGDAHPLRLESLLLLAYALDRQAKYSEADRVLGEVVPLCRRVLGDEHPGTLEAMFRTAVVLVERGKLVEAEAMHRDLHAMKRRLFGDEHPTTLLSAYYVAEVALRQGRSAEAEALFRKVLSDRRRIRGNEHPDTLHTMNNLGWALSDQGKYAEATALHQQTLETRRRVLGDEHPNTLVSANWVAELAFRQGRWAEAEDLFRNTLELRRRVLGEDHPGVAETLRGLAEVLEKTERLTQAEQIRSEAESIMAARLPREHRDRRANTNLLGGILCDLKRYSEAEPLLLESYEALRDAPDLPPRDKKELVERLVRLYESWDAAEPGKGYAEKAEEWRRKLGQENRE